MAKPVMVSLDGSEKDARALAVGAALAELAGTGLHLVRVFDTPVEGLSVRAGALGAVGAAGELRDDLRRALAGTADDLVASTGHPVTSEILDGADVPGVLMRAAAERDARVVVMGTRAAGAAGRALRGSVADRVMRESPRPVVLVPPGADRLRDKRIRIGRVLVPLDGSALAAGAVDYLLALPRADRLEYVLVEVVPPRSDGPARARAEQRLEAAAERVRARGAAAVEIAVLEARDPAAAIVGSVREALVDLIAMSTRGEGGLRRMVLGSVAEGVVRSSEVPVMLLTPSDVGADGDA
jgi:nucleotide-binding universal stress UspA family protein